MLENCLKNNNETMISNPNISLFKNVLKNSFTSSKTTSNPINKLPLINLNHNKINPEILKNRKLNPKFLISKDQKLLKYYQQLCDNKPLDKFPKDCDIRRFIILDIKTFETKENNAIISSITAIEIKNMEFTGMIFHSYLNCDLFIDENNNNDNFLYTLLDYCKEKNNNDKKSLEKLIEFIDGSMIILHNALIQIKLLNNELNKYNLETININNCICSLRMLRVMKFKNQNLKNIGYKISDLCNLFDIKVKESDFSLIKTIALTRCVLKMMKKDLENNNTIEIQDMNEKCDENENNKKFKINSEKRVKNNSERKIDMINNCNYNLAKEQKNGTISLMKFNKNFNFSNMCNNTINEFHLFFNKRNNNQNSLRTKSNEHTMNGKSYNKSKNKIMDGYDIMQFHDSIDKINEDNYDENVKNLIIDNEKNSNKEINKND